MVYPTNIIDSNCIYYLSILDVPGTSETTETFLEVPVAQNIPSLTGVFKRTIRKKNM